MKRLHGVCPIVAVPFTETGDVDAASFGRLVAHLLGEDIGGLTLFGLASEFYKLADDERSGLMEPFLAATSRHPRIAAIISVTAHSTEVAERRAIEAEAGGADIVNLLPPYFLDPPPEAVVAHLDRVLSAIQIPVIVQYAPLQTGSRLEPQHLAELSRRHPHLRYVKVEAQPPGEYIADLIAASDGRIDALIGHAGLHLPEALARGAVGLQPGCSFTGIYSELMRLHEQGNADGMRSLYESLRPYIASWMESVERIIQVEKTILWRRGLIESDYCRRPGYALSEGELATIDRFLEEFAPHLAGSPR